MKLKRLNNKGFTLIELLAVIVILAIVMGISANAVLTSINNSRKSALYSAAQNAANTINNWATEDAMASTSSQKVLGDSFINALKSGSWVCLNTGNIQKIVNRDTAGAANTNFLVALGISTNDIVLTDGGSLVPDGTAPKEGVSGGATKNTCSAIKYNSSFGGYELLLIAKNGGKYYVTTDSSHYAYSRATAENKPL